MSLENNSDPHYHGWFVPSLFITQVDILQELEGKLIDAARDGSTEEVIRLLDGGVNVDATDEVRDRSCPQLHHSLHEVYSRRP